MSAAETSADTAQYYVHTSTCMSTVLLRTQFKHCCTVCTSKQSKA